MPPVPLYIINMIFCLSDMHTSHNHIELSDMTHHSTLVMGFVVEESAPPSWYTLTLLMSHYACHWPH